MNKKLLLITIVFYSSLQTTMQLMSPAFSHNKPIPIQHTCDGQNISPALSWSNAPTGTNSFALIVDDPDAPSKIWVHWILFNIPSTVDSLMENTEEGPFIQGVTDFDNKQGYGGPCPPKGIHRYHFTLYALNALLDLSTSTNKEELLKAMQGHILEQTTLIGTYQRKK